MTKITYDRVEAFSSRRFPAPSLDCIVRQKRPRSHTTCWLRYDAAGRRRRRKTRELDSELLHPLQPRSPVSGLYTRAHPSAGNDSRRTLTFSNVKACFKCWTFVGHNLFAVPQSSQHYGNSHVTRDDRTVLPATRQRRRSCHNPSQSRYWIYRPTEMKGCWVNLSRSTLISCSRILRNDQCTMVGLASGRLEPPDYELSTLPTEPLRQQLITY